MNEIGVADYDPATPRVNDGSTSQDKLNGSSSSATYSTQIAASSSFEGPRLSFSASDVEAPAEVSIQRHEKPPKPRDEGSSMEAAARSLQQFAASVEEHPNAQFMSRGTTNSGQDEEAVVYSQTRMLQDPTGRLLYVGDSASLSFLQLLRMMVENVVGPSPFTNDPRRHKIMESQFSLPSNSRGTHLLPDKRTAYVLVDSFFVNVRKEHDPSSLISEPLIMIYRHKGFSKCLTARHSLRRWIVAIRTRFPQNPLGYACSI